MEHDFWLAKWAENELGFHLPDVHPLVRKYAERFAAASGIFVPLCGKSHDLAFYQSTGLPVVACDLSRIAARDYFETISPSKAPLNESSLSEHLLLYQQANCEFYIGDFFDMKAEQLSACSHIYDRAALIALPKELRSKYVAHMRQIMPSAAMLLITLDYDQNKMSGPPFSVNSDEVTSLFDFARIQELHRNNIIDDEPKFKSRGLSEFNQTAYWIDWT